MHMYGHLTCMQEMHPRKCIQNTTNPMWWMHVRITTCHMWWMHVKHHNGHSSYAYVKEIWMKYQQLILYHKDWYRIISPFPVPILCLADALCRTQANFLSISWCSTGHNFLYTNTGTGKVIYSVPILVIQYYWYFI